VNQEKGEENMYPTTHEIFLDLLECRHKEDGRQGSDGSPFVGGRDTRNLLDASGEEEE
jgi:hypothetical protein